MKIPVFAVLLLSFVSAAVLAADLPAAPSAPTAVQRVEVIQDAGQYLQRTRDVQALAHAGEYGRLSKRQLIQLDVAQKQIETLLTNRTDTASLSTNDQFALHDAQEVINSTIRANDKNRIVCKRIQQTGSRISAEECLTVAQREARSRAARESVKNIQDNECTPGEGQTCSK